MQKNTLRIVACSLHKILSYDLTSSITLPERNLSVEYIEWLNGCCRETCVSSPDLFINFELVRMQRHRGANMYNVIVMNWMEVEDMVLLLLLLLSWSRSGPNLDKKKMISTTGKNHTPWKNRSTQEWHFKHHLLVQLQHGFPSAISSMCATTEI